MTNNDQDVELWQSSSHYHNKIKKDIAAPPYSPEDSKSQSASDAHNLVDILLDEDSNEDDVLDEKASDEQKIKVMTKSQQTLYSSKLISIVKITSLQKSHG